MICMTGRLASLAITYHIHVLILPIATALYELLLHKNVNEYDINSAFLNFLIW